MRRIYTLGRFLLLLTLTVPAHADSPARAASFSRTDSAPIVFALADLGEADLSIKAIFDQATVHFPLAEGVQVQSATLHLHLSHDQKLLPQLSDLTLALNDEPVTNLLLTADNAQKTFVDVPLPVTALRAGDNALLLRFNLRLHDTGCSDRDNPNLWAKVFADSTIELAGVDTPLTPDLGRFPAPFTTLNVFGGPRLTLVLPASPTSVELTAAAQIAAALGQAALWEKPPVRAVTFDELDDTHKSDHLIVIDTLGRNPLAQDGPRGLTELVSPFNANRLMLVVSGADETDLQRATDALTTASARAALRGPHVDPAPVAPHPAPERATRATFADLNFTLRPARGLGLHDFYLPLDVPYDWKLTNDASIELLFTHAHGLSAANSRLSVFVNGFAVTSVPLTNRNDDDGRLTVQLSPRQMHPGRNWLHLVFDLHVPREDCNLRYLAEAWAEVKPESTLNLAHVVSLPPIELRFLPSSLVLPANLSSDVFVVPAQPAPADLSAMVNIAARLGTYTPADGLRPQARTARTFDPAQSPGADIILIGSIEANAVLAAHDAQLPQPLTRVNGLIRPAGGRNLQLAESLNEAGYIEVLPSPWSGGILVVISGDNAASLLTAAEATPTLGHRLKSPGNVAVVTANDVTGLTLGGLAGAPLSPLARGMLAFILISGVVAIGGVGWVAAARRRKQEQESQNATDE
jgi:hypothetical protein